MSDISTMQSNNKDSRIARIQAALQTSLAPQAFDLQDESALHAGHAGAVGGGSHYRLHIVSEFFTGLSRVKRHRLVYDCLLSMMATEIHALAIEALTPAEAAEKASANVVR